MDKLRIADPDFLPKGPIVPLPGKQPPRKLKKKKLTPEELINLDMDNLDEELSLLGIDDDDDDDIDSIVPYTPMKKSKIRHDFAMEIVKRRLEGEKMPEPMYDEDGCPILPDGRSRLFTIPELMNMSRQEQARLSSAQPKRKKMSPKKAKLRKNPPPKKVDIEALFREEIKRREALERMN